MNLLCITTYTGLGGGETSLLTLVEALTRRDPDLRLHLLTPQDGQLGERWRALGGTTHISAWRGASVYFVPQIYARFPVVRRMARLMREQQIDIIHSDYHSLPFAAAAAQIARVPLVWTCWGWWFRPKSWQRAFFRHLTVPPNHTFTASWAIKAGFLGDPPFVAPNRVEVLPPGVDTARFRPGIDGSPVRADANVLDNAPLVALIARFQDVKGHDTFQAVARRVVDALPAARFIVAGENVHGATADDAYKARILAAWRADPILREKLTYIGFRADAERVIAAADVIVCPSRFESYGMVNVEAMACGKPVVSTRAGGPSETIVDGETDIKNPMGVENPTGYLVDAGDVSAFAARVVQLLNDADLRIRMGAAGRARVERLFSAEAMAARFGTVIDGLIGR